MTTNTIAETRPLQSVTAPAAAKPSRKRLARNAIALVAAAFALWTGAHRWAEGRFMEETDDAYVGANITVVSPKVAGYISQLAVSDNQVVRAGEVIARLDDRDFRAALNKAEAAVAAAEAQLVNLDATRELQDAMIGQARATVSASAAETVRAREDEQRYRSLVANAAVSVQAEQKTSAAYQQALADTEKTQAQLLAAQRELKVIDTRKQQARAALDQAVAERDIAKLNLEYTVIRAPVDGTVGNRRARLGSYAAVGSQLLSIVPAGGLWIDANFKEDQLARFHAGQRVTVKADVLPGRVFHGRLASLAPATGAQFSVLPPENATGNFTKIVQRVPVRVLLDEADARLGLLRPGLSVLAEVDVRGDGRPR
jgi:membrane fusion protein (multidrug efflux system)